MAQYIKITEIESRVNRIKSDLQRWAHDNYDKAVSFGTLAIGVENNGILRMSLPYQVAGDSEKRYWIEEL